MENLILEFNNNSDIAEIVKLSKEFEEENCCYGFVSDDEDYFKDKKIVVARQNERIIGYCYFTLETKSNDSSFYKKGQNTLYIEEIFVKKEYRSHNIGQKLFTFAELYAKENNCSFIEVSAVNKNYNKIISFYIDKLNMTLWSAHMIKKIN